MLQQWFLGLLSASFQTHPPGYNGESLCCQHNATRRLVKRKGTHRIHAWYIHLHLVDFYGKCRCIYHTLILWGTWIESFRQTLQNTSKYLGTLDVLALANIIFRTMCRTDCIVLNWLSVRYIYAANCFFWKHQDSKTNVSILPPQNQVSSALVLSWDLYYDPSWKTMDKRRQYYWWLRNPARKPPGI